MFVVCLAPSTIPHLKIAGFFLRRFRKPASSVIRLFQGRSAKGWQPEPAAAAPLRAAASLGGRPRRVSQRRCVTQAASQRELHGKPRPGEPGPGPGSGGGLCPAPPGPRQPRSIVRPARLGSAQGNARPSARLPTAVLPAPCSAFPCGTRRDWKNDKACSRGAGDKGAL